MTMKKEKFHIEYVFDNVSRRCLWNQLTTSVGLSAWFADDVVINGDNYKFIWNKTSQEANVIESKPESRIRYRWAEEDDENAYLEFIIHKTELTGITSLEITDFAEPGEKRDSIDLWDSQVEELKRALGL